MKLQLRRPGSAERIKGRRYNTEGHVKVRRPRQVIAGHIDFFSGEVILKALEFVELGG